MKSATNSTINEPQTDDISVNLSLLPQILPRQSNRWCRLTSTLWSLIALDAQRNVDLKSFIQFIEVISWRANGKITQEEFSIIFAEWIKADLNNKQSSNLKKKTLISLNGLRALLIEKKYVESDLDLFIGMIINEINLKLINTTISFVNKSQSIKKSNQSFNLEVVNQNWLSLSEELFFIMDTPGYGSLRFDDALFFCSALCVGLQSWNNESELEADLALSSVTAVTYQFMRDCGVQLPVTSTRNGIYDPAFAEQQNRILNQKATLKQEITLAMFKKYLIKKNIGEVELATLILHIRSCLERIIRLVKVSGAEEFFLACQPIEHKGTVVGTPRLWQEATLISSGYQITQHNISSLPPVLLFLLSDAEKYISGTFRAIEFPIEGLGFINNKGPFPEENSQFDPTNPIFSVIAANEELHDNAFRILSHYRKWAQDTSPYVMRSREILSAVSATNSLDLQRDPVYQLILASLLQYKRLQHILNAALFDFSIAQFGPSPMNVTNPPNSLALLCAGMIPSGKNILVELGLGSVQDLSNDDLETDQLNKDLAFSNDFQDSRKSIFINPPSTDHTPVKVSDEKRKSMILEDTTIDPLASDELNTRFTKVSNLPLAEKRKSMLKKLDQSHNSAVGISSSNKSETPNYSKPTEAFSNKVSRKTPFDSVSDNGESQIKQTKNSTGEIKSPFFGTDRQILDAQWKSLLDTRKLEAFEISPSSSNQRLSTMDLGNDFKEDSEEKQQHENMILSLDSIPPIPPELSPHENNEELTRNIRSNSSPSEVSSSAPNSISEMLQQGQNPGKYAQMLREILRKMSKDDSKVKVKSLEQIIALGNTIVENDNEEKRKIVPVQRSVSPNSSQILESKSITKKKETQNPISENPPNKLEVGRLNSSNTQTQQYISQNALPSNTVRRSLKAPGVVPNGEGKKSKKAFGHPVNN